MVLDHGLSSRERARQSPLAAPPLHQCITLPYALHVEPMPSLHYQAVPYDPADTSRRQHDVDGEETSAEDTLGYEQPHSCVIGSNVRLQPLVIQPPAHDLDAISLLLEHSRAMEALPYMVHLIRLLDRADDDPHFSRLLSFFDARYDPSTGRIIGDGDITGSTSADPHAKTTNRLGRIVSRSRRTRTASSTATSAFARSRSMSLGQGGSILSPSSEGDEDMTVGGQVADPRWTLTQSPPSSVLGGGPYIVPSHARWREIPHQAPHLLVALTSDPSKVRSVAFPVRLDLQNAGKGLCPFPPIPTEGSPMPSTVRQDTTSDEIDGEAASSAGIVNSLRRVLTPDSARSDRSMLSSASHSSTGAEELNTSHRSTRAATSAATASDTVNHRSRSATESSVAAHAVGGSESKAPRRPSALQRFLGRRKSRARQSSSGSVTTGSDWAVEIEEEEDERSTLPDLLSSNDRGGKAGGRSDAPIGSATNDFASAAEHVHLAPGTRPISIPAHQQTGHRSEMAQADICYESPSPHWAGAGMGQAGEALPSFLEALRRTAEVGLSLPTPCSHPLESHGSGAGAGPKRRSSASSGRADDFDHVFLQAKRGEISDEDTSWYPTGSNDPLPVVIAAALGPALGWQGILSLCYGPDSLAARSGDLKALGRAAALAERTAEPTSVESSQDESSTSTRTLTDWQRLFASISRWVELYEMTRVRGGLAREVGLDGPLPANLQGGTSIVRAQYSLSSGIIPVEVVTDASNRAHAYRRRMGIPEGFPATEDGLELGDYRWSRKRLGIASVATAMTLTAASLAHFFSACVDGTFTYQAAWELDYLEAQVLKTPVIAERFPPPMHQAVASSSHPFDDTPESQSIAEVRAKACPNPTKDGWFRSDEWVQWCKEGLERGSIITPAISVQAWWAIIGLLNGGGQTGVDLQILGKGENWRDVAEESSDAEIQGYPVYI
ncbi:unnamed protein product [Parajaminaea phylloscopi]